MLEKQQLRDLYFWLHLNRAADDRLSALYRTGRIVGGVFTGRGQEAVSVGAAYALQEGDLLSPMLRNCGALLVRGMSLREMFAHFMGRSKGPTRGKEGNVHFGDLQRGILAPIGIAGAMVPVAAGAALAAKMQKKKSVVLGFIGDGGTSTTDFHEGLNFAAVQKVPLVLVIENNGWAYSTPVKKQTACANFITRARGYGIHGIDVDGNDVVAVYDAARSAVQMAREGKGPVLVSARTMRMKGHAEHDGAAYMPAAELAAWHDRDPVGLFESYLSGGNFLSDPERAMILDRVRVEVDDAAAFAESCPFPEGPSALGGVYSELH
jgi:TPP-dependent pyruvate/acetoin dehydrogenase alpha subunit